jgi:hypothetical protein
MLSVAAPVCCAKDLTSDATAANPLPAYPTRARFNGGIERQHVGLSWNLRDGLDDASYLGLRTDQSSDSHIGTLHFENGSLSDLRGLTHLALNFSGGGGKLFGGGGHVTGPYARTLQAKTVGFIGRPRIASERLMVGIISDRPTAPIIIRSISLSDTSTGPFGGLPYGLANQIFKVASVAVFRLIQNWAEVTD